MIKLDDIIEAIDFANNDMEQYLNTDTGEIILVGDYSPDNFDRDELEFNNAFIALPTQFEINEYAIMEDFIEDKCTNSQQALLSRVIQGKGAFRNFKDMVHELGIEKRWYTYLDERHHELAITWCKENDITYAE